MIQTHPTDRWPGKQQQQQQQQQQQHRSSLGYNFLTSSKVNSVLFEDPLYHINPIYNTHEDTHLIDTQEQDTEDYEV